MRACMRACVYVRTLTKVIKLVEQTPLAVRWLDLHTPRETENGKETHSTQTHTMCIANGNLAHEAGAQSHLRGAPTATARSACGCFA